MDKPDQQRQTEDEKPGVKEQTDAARQQIEAPAETAQGE
jgi:hypothetical protein